MDAGKIITGLFNMPDSERDPDIHAYLYSSEYKRVVSMMLISEARTCDPTKMSKTEMTAKLAKLWNFSLLLDLPEIVKNNAEPKNQQETEEEIL